jgi:hypothetical protein
MSAESNTSAVIDRRYSQTGAVRTNSLSRSLDVPVSNYRMPELGKFLVIIGVVIVAVGIILWTGIGTGFLGKLPGDIRIERGNSAFYFPIVTCIIISIVLSLIFSLFRR